MCDNGRRCRLTPFSLLRDAERLEAGPRAGHHEAAVAAADDVLESLGGSALAVLDAAGRDARDLAGVPAGLDDLLQRLHVLVAVGRLARIDAHREGHVAGAGPAAV